MRELATSASIMLTLGEQVTVVSSSDLAFRIVQGEVSVRKATVKLRVSQVVQMVADSNRDKRDFLSLLGWFAGESG